CCSSRGRAEWARSSICPEAPETGRGQVRSPGSRTGRGAMSDWTTDAVDNIERVVTTVRDTTVTPAQNVTRAIVFGLLTALSVATALTIVSIGLFRLLDVYLPGGVWAAYLVFAGVFVVAGMFCWA